MAISTQPNNDHRNIFVLRETIKMFAGLKMCSWLIFTIEKKREKMRAHTQEKIEEEKCFNKFSFVSRFPLWPRHYLDFGRFSVFWMWSNLSNKRKITALYFCYFSVFVPLCWGALSSVQKYIEKLWKTEKERENSGSNSNENDGSIKRKRSKNRMAIIMLSRTFLLLHFITNIE